MVNRDLKLLRNIEKYSEEQIPNYLDDLDIKDDKREKFEYPLDTQVIEILNELKIREDDDDFRIFYYLDTIKKAWKLIIDKSIKCLRFFDKREPFLENNTKHPIAYGIDELSEYFEKYSNFESMLYGGAKYYRDHVVHVFRVWMLGLDCLLYNSGAYLKMIEIQKDITINNLEKISIWSMIALTHDLGYPLEKSQQIIDRTKDMMKSFVANPILSMDLSFNGVQNSMNDFVVRFMSSKMKKVNDICPKDNTKIKEEKYVARLQPKYYFKFQKSLEKCKHGILSSIIIYKLLIYFLESDYNINEDYYFKEEDARQFYIRREILRSIASHTCRDIYHLDMLSFAYLLIIADDSQEWGRKRISELYVKDDSLYEFGNITFKFNIKKINVDNEDIDIHECIINEKFTFVDGDISGLKVTLKSLDLQSKSYKELFRDGQETAKRNFIFRKQCEIIYDKDRAITYIIEFKISNEEKSRFAIKLKSSDMKQARKNFGQQFLENIYKHKVIESDKSSADEIIYELEDNDD